MISYVAQLSCSYPTCGRPHRAKGYCSVHYYQLRRTGRVFDIVPTGTPRPECKMPECGAAHFARGYCQAHHRSEYTRYAKYGLTKDQFDQMVVDQDGRCAVCRTELVTYAVDHDHTCCPEQNQSCGRCVRGLLCTHCNTGLAMFRDRQDVLQAAILYLQTTKPDLP